MQSHLGSPSDSSIVACRGFQLVADYKNLRLIPVGDSLFTESQVLNRLWGLSTQSQDGASACQHISTSGKINPLHVS